MLEAKSKIILSFPVPRSSPSIQPRKNHLRFHQIRLPEDVHHQKVAVRSVVTLAGGFGIPSDCFLKMLFVIVAVVEGEREFELRERVTVFRSVLDQLVNFEIGHLVIV